MHCTRIFKIGVDAACALGACLILIAWVSDASGAGRKFAPPPTADEEPAADLNLKTDITVGPPPPMNGATLEAPSTLPTEPGAEEEEDDQIFSLDKCLRLAMVRNQRLKGAGYDVEAAQGQLIEAKAPFMPVLEYTWRIAPVPTDVNDAFNKFFEGQVTLFNSFHIGLGFPILTFGQLQTAKNMAKNGVEAARISEIKAQEVVIYQVKNLYYGSQLAMEMIGLLEDAVKKLENKIVEEETREEGGMDPYDLMKLKVTKVDLERRLAESRQHLELALEGLRIQMDLEPGTPVELDSDKIRPVLAKLGEEQDYIDAAMVSQPDARLVDIGVDTKRKQYKLEKFKLLPVGGFAFFADVGRTTGFVAGITATGDYNDPFNYTRAGIGIQFKGTIDFHGAYGRIKKARAEYYKATYDRLIARRGISLDVRRAYLQARRAQEDVARARKGESLARQMTFMSKINIDMGLEEGNQKYGDALMLLLLQRGYYYKSIFDYNMALADLAQKVTVARYEQLTTAPTDATEYELFEEGADDEEFETYGIESDVTLSPGPPAGEQPALMGGMMKATNIRSRVGGTTETNKGESDGSRSE